MTAEIHFKSVAGYFSFAFRNPGVVYKRVKTIMCEANFAKDSWRTEEREKSTTRNSFGCCPVQEQFLSALSSPFLAGAANEADVPPMAKSAVIDLFALYQKLLSHKINFVF